MTLAAFDGGLGTCWIGAFSQEEARDILKVQAKYQIVALLPLGFPKQPEGPKARKSLNEIACYETFKEKNSSLMPSSASLKREAFSFYLHIYPALQGGVII